MFRVFYRNTRSTLHQLSYVSGSGRDRASSVSFPTTAMFAPKSSALKIFVTQEGIFAVKRVEISTWTRG